MNLVLGDPPFSTIRKCAEENSDHEKIMADDVMAMFSLFRGTLKQGSHGHMFCRNLQYGTWLRMSAKEVEE